MVHNQNLPGSKILQNPQIQLLRELFAYFLDCRIFSILLHRNIGVGRESLTPGKFAFPQYLLVAVPAQRCNQLH
jgi:hypothetical protein